MLAAYLDASAHVRVAGERQEVRAQLRGLRVETQVDLGTQEGEVGRIPLTGNTLQLLSCMRWHAHDGSQAGQAPYLKV